MPSLKQRAGTGLLLNLKRLPTSNPEWEGSGSLCVVLSLSGRLGRLSSGHLDEAEGVDDRTDRLHDLGFDAVDLGEESTHGADGGLAQDLVGPDHQAVECRFAPRVHRDLAVHGDEAGPVLAIPLTTPRPEAGRNGQSTIEEPQDAEVVVVDEAAGVVELLCRSPVVVTGQGLDPALEGGSGSIHLIPTTAVHPLMDFDPLLSA